jgi:hypothetical protein
MNLTLVLKTKIAYEGWTVPKIMERIDEHLGFVSKGEVDPYKGETVDYPTNQKKDFFSSQIS